MRTYWLSLSRQSPQHVPSKATQQRLARAGFILPEFSDSIAPRYRGRSRQEADDAHEAEQSRKRALLAHQAQALARNMDALRVQLVDAQRQYQAEARLMFATRRDGYGIACVARVGLRVYVMR